MMRNANHRRRNFYFATAITLLAMSFLFAPGDDGMLWMMWRDTTWLAVAMVLLAVMFIVLWRRSPRPRGRLRRPGSAKA